MALLPSWMPASESVNGAINSFFGADSIDVIRSIDYDVKYLWTARFVTGAPPKPFDGFFPANDVSIPIAVSSNETITFGQTSFEFPVKSEVKQLTMTFYDNDKRVILNWLSDWINLDIQNGGKFMSGLEDTHAPVRPRLVELASASESSKVMPLRTVELNLLSRYKKVDKSLMLDIFPVGELKYEGNHASEAQMYTMNFVVVREHEIKPNNSTGFTDIAKDILSRFI